jgi:hypothetical protein
VLPHSKQRREKSRKPSPVMRGACAFLPRTRWSELLNTSKADEELHISAWAERLVKQNRQQVGITVTHPPMPSIVRARGRYGVATRRPVELGHAEDMETVCAIPYSLPMTASTCSSGADEARKTPEYGPLKSRIRYAALATARAPAATARNDAASPPESNP